MVAEASLIQQNSVLTKHWQNMGELDDIVNCWA